MRTAIDHVVVLMLANRSFDHLLGLLYENDTEPENRPDFQGVRLGDPAFSNPLDPAQRGSRRVPVSGDGEASLSVETALSFTRCTQLTQAAAQEG
ncbi:MAG TPA: hypothetical protein VFI47_30115 [Acidimicrobiales bacterium]|nr:hypothetical protein [Acidimicrobiales bacterium]